MLVRILPTLRKCDWTILRFLDLVDVEDGCVMVLLVALLIGFVLVLLVDLLIGFVLVLLVDLVGGFVLILVDDLLKGRLILLVEVVDGFVVFVMLIESLDTFVVFLVDLVDTSSVLFIPFLLLYHFYAFFLLIKSLQVDDNLLEIVKVLRLVRHHHKHTCIAGM